MQLNGSRRAARCPGHVQGEGHAGNSRASRNISSYVKRQHAPTQFAQRRFTGEKVQSPRVAQIALGRIILVKCIVLHGMNADDVRDCRFDAHTCQTASDEKTEQTAGRNRPSHTHSLRKWPGHQRKVERRKQQFSLVFPKHQTPRSGAAPVWIAKTAKRRAWEAVSSAKLIHPADSVSTKARNSSVLEPCLSDCSTELPAGWLGPLTRRRSQSWPGCASRWGRGTWRCSRRRSDSRCSCRCHRRRNSRRGAGCGCRRDCWSSRGRRRWGNCRCRSGRGCRCGRRSSCRRDRRSRCRCGGPGRCWCWAATARRLNLHLHGRAGLEEAYRGGGALRRLIGVETEVIQCAKSNGVGVLVLGKGLARPGNGTVPSLIIVAPRRAAVALIVERAVVGPARLLRRSMETDVAEGDSGAQWDGERLNRAIQVHVVERIFVMPHPGGGIGHLVADEPGAVIARVGLELAHGGPCPCHDGRLHPHR